MLLTLAGPSVARVDTRIPLKRLIRAVILGMIGRNGLAVNIADRVRCYARSCCVRTDTATLSVPTGLAHLADSPMAAVSRGAFFVWVR